MGTANLQIATWGNLSSSGHTVPSGKTSTECVTYEDLESVSTVKPFTYSYYRLPDSSSTSALTINMPLTKTESGFIESGYFNNIVGRVIYSFKPPVWIRSKVKFPLTSITLEHWENTIGNCQVTLNIKVYLVNTKDDSVVELKKTEKIITCEHNANQSQTKTEIIFINWDDLYINFNNYQKDSEFEVRLDLTRDSYSTNASYMQYKFTYNYS